MASVQTKVFLSNRSQAVRLPKAVELPATVKEVDVVAVGTTRIITPAGTSWDVWFDEPGVSEDVFSEGREQPTDQRREPL